jgi:hypothetical protein
MKLFILFFTLCSFSLFSQEKTITINESKIGLISCEHKLKVNLDNNDSSFYGIIVFQNMKYSTIVDHSYIYFPLKKVVIGYTDITQFQEDLKSAILEFGNKVEISWDREGYELAIHDFSNLLYLRQGEKHGSGYTRLTKKQAEKLIEWCELVIKYHSTK